MLLFLAYFICFFSGTCKTFANTLLFCVETVLIPGIYVLFFPRVITNRHLRNDVGFQEISGAESNPLPKHNCSVKKKQKNSRNVFVGYT
uniref:Uncharacterized protein n=1 Tax=Ixodes ricinus TaxID=34613 RepID=A0A6B0UBE1_IXORI